MAHAQINTARFEQPWLTTRFQQIRDMLEERAARRAVYRRTVDELQSYSDRDLADLGFHRSEIPHIARKAAGQV